jgi:hypothetical protein
MHETVSIANQTQNSPTAAANEVLAAIDQQPDPETQLTDRFPIQLKLSVGAPNDPLEHEADAIADKVMRMPDMPFVQNKSATDGYNNCDGGHVQLKPIPPVVPFGYHKSTSIGPDVDDYEHMQLKPLASQITPFIQTKGDAGGVASDAVSSRIKSSMGGGSSMSGDTKTFMESRFGTDFSDVKIHAGSEAAQLSQSLNARAFTVSNNIYFNNGQYQPDSDAGKHLLAHELTHTIQQGSSVKRKSFIQRAIAGATPAAPTKGKIAKAVPKSNKATPEKPINTKKGLLYVPDIQVPTLKMDVIPVDTNNYAFKKTTRSDTHITKWNNAATTGGKFSKNFKDKVAKEIPTEKAAKNFFMRPKSELDANGKAKGASVKQLITGDQAQIRQSITRPFWDKEGNIVDDGYDVDHKVELQLGGMDDLPNLWMLEAGTNRSSGSKINDEINTKVSTQYALVSDDKVAPTPEELKNIRNNYTITAGTLSGGMTTEGNKRGWELSQIKDGEHLDGLAFISQDDEGRKNLAKSDALSLILSQRFGVTKNFPWDSKIPTAAINKSVGFIKKNGTSLNLKTITYNHKDPAAIMSEGSDGKAEISALEGNVFVTKELNTTVDIEKVPGLYGGRLNISQAKQAISKDIKARALSPIIIDELDINDTAGLVGSGRIITDVPLIKGSAIKLVLDESGVKISKTFSSGEIKLPPPFKVSDTSLEIYASTDGIGIKGEANFEITKLGKGKLKAKADSAGTFALSGSFDFDSKTFDPAHVEVNYLNGELSVKGEIGIPEGKIKGLKSALITVGYANNSLTADGSAEFNIKGIKQNKVTISYEKGLLVIAGDFEVDKGIPGIKSGGGSLKVTRGGDGKYHISARGHAEPDIPKVNPKLSISYEDGALTMEGQADYKADRLSGTVTVGATNRTLNAEGAPTGAPGDHFNVYGTGMLTVKITEWLQGTAKIKLTPNKEIEVVGRLEVPKPVNFFDRKSINKPLFHPPEVQIPIFAIPLGNRSVGLVGIIRGGLDFDAGIGPGQLRDIFAEIKYNPSRPDDTTFKAGAQIAIPANAGITMSAYVGVGASVLIASVSGGIKISGRLGLDGEARAKAEVSWSPKNGFALDGLGEIEVRPQFTFTIDALILASLDLYVTSYDHEFKKELKSFTFGPNMQAKVAMPVHYKQGEEFKISKDDIQVTYPSIDIPEMAKGLGNKAKEAIFGQ